MISCFNAYNDNYDDVDQHDAALDDADKRDTDLDDVCKRQWAGHLDDADKRL